MGYSSWSIKEAYDNGLRLGFLRGLAIGFAVAILSNLVWAWVVFPLLRK